MNPLFSRRFTRRQFVQSSAFVATAFGFPAIVSAKSPNSKLNLAIIGVGGEAVEIWQVQQGLKTLWHSVM